MAFNAATVSSLNGSFKQRHLPKLEKLVGEDQHLTRDIPFEEGVKEGALFRQPVYLTRPHGITFSASDSAPTLNAPIAAQTKELSFDAYQLIMRERISYDAADRMAGSDAAYISATGDLPTWLRMAHMHYVEMMLWYGQSSTGIGQIATGGVTGNVCTIAAAEWAPQIWVGSENMRLDVYRAGAFVKTASVTAYNVDFSNGQGGSVTLDSAAGVNAADVFYPAGSFGNSYRGIDTIITEASNQFGQSPATYNLLKGVQQTCSNGTLKFKTLLYGLAKARAKGLSKKATLYVSEFTFPDLVDEVESARTDSQRGASASNQSLRGTEIKRGADNMTVLSPNGTFEIQVSSYCKKGSAYGLIQDGSWSRYGTSDVTFRVPGSKDEEFYMHLQDVAGYEIRSWANFANYTPRAGSNVKFTNILNGIDGGS
jgi:hypothetical protein